MKMADCIAKMIITTLVLSFFGSSLAFSIDGNWSTWSNWTSCSTTCSVGIRSRTRRCDNPTPFNGKTCLQIGGDSFEQEDCVETKNCPSVDTIFATTNTGVLYGDFDPEAGFVNFSSLDTGYKSGVAIDIIYDKEEERLFWVDTSNFTIESFSFETGMQTTILSNLTYDSTRNPLAYDSVTKTIYFISGITLFSADSSGNQIQELITDDTMTLHDPVVDGVNGFIFMVAHISSLVTFQIRRYNLDNITYNSTSVIYNDVSSMPITALTVSKDLLYYHNRLLSRMYRCQLDGSNNEFIVVAIGSIHSLNVYTNDILFFSNGTFNKLNVTTTTPAESWKIGDVVLNSFILYKECEPACKNGGVCEQDECRCPKKFVGPTCKKVLFYCPCALPSSWTTP